MMTLERELRYASAGREWFPLPSIEKEVEDHLNTQAEVFCGCYSHFVIARVLYLLYNEEAGSNTFPSDDSLRYDHDDFALSVTEQRILLPEQYTWMCYFSRGTPLTLEFQTLFRLIGWTMSRGFLLVEKVHSRCIQARLITAKPCKRVQNFTPATCEAVSSGHDDCPICSLEFAEAAARDDVEPAVKTHCGHFIGKDCLQSCVDSWHDGEKQGPPTCPCCRAPLYNRIDMLPAALQPVVREWIAHVRNDIELDREVDAFLLASREDDIYGCYDASLGTMPEKLAQRWRHYVEFEDMIDAAFERLRLAGPAVGGQG